MTYFLMTSCQSILAIKDDSDDRPVKSRKVLGIYYKHKLSTKDYYRSLNEAI